MDSRHDSFLGFDKLDSGSAMDVPSSPLSSVPGDFDVQPVPEDLLDSPVPDNPSGLKQSADVPDMYNSAADAIHVAVPGRASFSAETIVRRSDRKRKRPVRFLQPEETGSTSESEVSGPSTKQRRLSPPKVIRSISRRRTQDQRNQVTNTVDSHAPIYAAISQTDKLSVPTSDDQQEDMSLIAPSTKSRVITIKVDPDRLEQVLHPAADSVSSSNYTPPTNPEVEPDVLLPSTQIPSEIAGEDLISLSVALTRKLPIDQKPKPRGEPEIWSDSRHHLCESLGGLYAAWQGSYYGKNGIAKAFMLDGNGHPRDHLDENVIILRASGSMAKDGDNGMKQCQDQEQKHQYHAMVNAINQQSPVAVICGNKNSQVPSKMPHKYNSLDWYKITHVWTEKDKYHVIKYRLEKLDSAVTGWWVPEDWEQIVELGSLAPALKQECGVCNQEYDQIYLCGWMCLNSKCKQFWSLADGSIPDAAQLIYDPRFLKQKTPWLNEQAPISFRFPLYMASPIAGEDYKVDNLRGMTCPECGKCNARVKWEGWECTGCGFEHKPKINPLPAACIQDQDYPVTAAYAASYDSAVPHVKVSIKFSHNYRWITYKFRVSATEEGEVVHGIANKIVREEKEGPNEMWEHLQENCHGLVRRELSNALMNSFTINYGMPYKFIAAGDSLPFTDAPWPITEAVSRLNWADRMTSGNAVENQEKFNELYLVAYLQDQSMNYHDDGEEGLGSTVATLSLGARAEMGFKPKSAFYHGLKKITHKKQPMMVMTTDQPLPEFPNYELRKQFIAEIESSDLKKDERMERLAEMAKDLIKAYPPKKGHTKVDDYIKLSLGHGDIVIMRGAHLQKWFEHGVSPKGLMRYALTCRTVLPGHLKKSELPDYEIDLPQSEYDGSRIARS